jgi:hypothetical protein
MFARPSVKLPYDEARGDRREAEFLMALSLALTRVRETNGRRHTVRKDDGFWLVQEVR